MVSRKPARKGGPRPRQNLAPGPDNSGIWWMRALRFMDQRAMERANTASANQTSKNAGSDAWPAAIQAAPNAVQPMPTLPHPGTAVKAEARSMVERI